MCKRNENDSESISLTESLLVFVGHHCNQQLLTLNISNYSKQKQVLNLLRISSENLFDIWSPSGLK